LLAEPQRERALERQEARGRVREVRLQDAVELLQRLVVEADVVEILDGDPGLLHAELRGEAREGGVVALAGEALLLRGGDDLAVLDQGGGAVVVERRDTEDVSRLSVCHAGPSANRAASLDAFLPRAKPYPSQAIARVVGVVGACLVRPRRRMARHGSPWT